MDYPKHYAALIERARLRSACDVTETHHVIPRCMGGGNESANLVELTPEEHFVAHQLLTKMHPTDRGLALGAAMMANYRNLARGTNKGYGWLKRGLSEARIGVARTPEARAAISEGHKRSEKAKAARLLTAAGRVGSKHSEESRRKMSESCRGRPCSEETRERRSKSLKGRVFSPEHRAKLSAALKGKRNALGAVRSPETRLKMSLAKRGLR